MQDVGAPHLEERELIADALALAAAERQVRKVLRGLVGHLLVEGEAVRVELVRVIPQPRVAMQVPHADEEVRAVRTTTYCPPRHPTHRETSLLESNGIL